jgi:hypothetical protein
MNIMNTITETKVLRFKMVLPLEIWDEFDVAMDLNSEWSERLLSRDIEGVRLADIVHDIRGILKGCEFFLPRL